MAARGGKQTYAVDHYCRSLKQKRTLVCDAVLSVTCLWNKRRPVCWKIVIWSSFCRRKSYRTFPNWNVMSTGKSK